MKDEVFDLILHYVESRHQRFTAATTYTLEYLITLHVFIHSFIRRSSIQIDTKSLELVIYHQFNNIKMSFFA